MTTNQDQSRAEFEAWHREEFQTFNTMRDPYKHENYHVKIINERWEVWQAARRAPSVVLPAEKDEGEELGWLAIYKAMGWNECVKEAKRLNSAPSTPAVVDGMPASQEPKYGIRDNRLYNRSSGEFIPEDEPVFIFRARDVHAFSILAHYGNEVCNPAHAAAILARVNDFKRFWNNNPDRMKEPDTDVSPAGSAQAGRDALRAQAILSQAAYHVRNGYKSEPLARSIDAFISNNEAAADGAGELPPLDDSFLDYHLNLILIASGSALRHYSMHKTKEDMRIALRETIKAARRMK